MTFVNKLQQMTAKEKAEVILLRICNKHLVLYYN